ncbi:MAG: DUF58 domain-containing protein [Anaerolineales bacterium]|nr:DUF58 domain-containing protein [Anaerolineales bacterium]
MKSTLRLNAKMLPVIGLLALVMQFIDPSRVWIILITGIGGIWLVCWWWARGLARSLQFKREMRYGWAQVGDRLEERFTLTNDFALPATWVSVQDHSTLPNHRVSVATGVDRMSTSQWKKLNQCTQRGVFTLGGTTLETGDPFGIYTVIIEDTTSSTLAVMPPIVSLPRFNILSSGWAGDGKISPRSLEETTNASHTREMVPGDPMKSIHWKTSARRNKFYVRQSDGTHAGDWWVLLDLHKDSQVGTGWDSTEEHGVILTSSLISQGLREDHPVGLAINGNEPAWHIPRRNENQERSLLKSLAVASPSDMGLKDFLHRANKAFSSRCSLLIVTPCADIEWIQALMPLTWRGILPHVFLFDVNTFGGNAKINEVSGVLQSLGIPCHIIPKEMLDKPQARPGHEGEWEWRVSATGKAIAMNKPVTDWKGLE